MSAEEPKQPLDEEVESGGASGEVTIAAADAGGLIGAWGLSVALVAFGIAAAGFSFGERVDDPHVWGPAEFFGAVGFGAFLVLLGWAHSLFDSRATDVGHPRATGQTE